MAEALSAEAVIEREIERFQTRYERANTEAQEAKAQVDKLKQALAALRQPSAQGQNQNP
jgi:ribosomal protein L29